MIDDIFEKQSLFISELLEEAISDEMVSEVIYYASRIMQECPDKSIEDAYWEAKLECFINN